MQQTQHFKIAVSGAARSFPILSQGPPSSGERRSASGRYLPSSQRFGAHKSDEARTCRPDLPRPSQASCIAQGAGPVVARRVHRVCAEEALRVDARETAVSKTIMSSSERSARPQRPSGDAIRGQSDGLNWPRCHWPAEKSLCSSLISCWVGEKRGSRLPKP